MDPCVHESDRRAYPSEVWRRCISVYNIPEAPYSLQCDHILSVHWYSPTSQLHWNKW